MKASVIVPTFERESFLERIYRCFQWQTHEDIELLVLDDSPQPSKFFTTLNDDLVSYSHSPHRLSTGAKRNLLVERASGEVIVQFDDDDFYSPQYVEAMLRLLGDQSLVKLSGFFVYGVRSQFFGYWDTKLSSPISYVIQPQGPYKITKRVEASEKNILGYGFSYVFRRKVFEQVRFRDMGGGQDYDFVARLRQVGMPIVLHADSEGLCLHIVHRDNTSRVFPQFHLPHRLLSRLFGAGVADFVK